MKSIGDKMQPWRTPDLTEKLYVWYISISTLYSKFWNRLMRSTIFCGNPLCLSIFHSVLWCMLSTAFLKSMKPIHRGAFYSILCSMMLWRENIWSVYPFPLRIPTCSWRSVTSISPSIMLPKLGRIACLVLIAMLFLSNYHSVEDLPSLVASLLDPYSNHWVNIICPYISKEVSEDPACKMYVCLEHFCADVISRRLSGPLCCIVWVTSCSVGTPVPISISSFGVGVSSYGSWFSVQNFWKVLNPPLSLGFLCSLRIPFLVLNNSYTCLGVSAELFGQSINCNHFPSLCSSFHFHCNIVHMSSLVVPSAFLDLLIFDTVF